MAGNREIVADAFAAWSRGEGYVASIFADEMTWEIVGRSRVSRRYGSAREFGDEVLRPFGARFGPDTPFRPVAIRGIHADGDTVVVLFDGHGIANDGLPYDNSYAWFLELRDGAVVDGTAFFDSVAFDDLWTWVPAQS